MPDDYPDTKSLNLPDGYTGPRCVELPNGNCRFYFFVDGQVVGSVDQTPQEIAMIASNILNSAHNAVIDAGKGLSEPDMPPLRAPIIVANKFGLAPSPYSDCQTLTIRVGEAVIGFAIHNNFLTQLGLAFRAAAVVPGKPN